MVYHSYYLHMIQLCHQTQDNIDHKVKEEDSSMTSFETLFLHHKLHCMNSMMSSHSNHRL
jgi:hypothetical protein